MLADRPDVLWAVVRILARRLRATDEALADAMFLDVTGRTAKRLLELADGEDDFRMPLTQEELAGMVGASRERVNKAIALFVKLGWLEISGRSRYRIVNRDELEIRDRLSRQEVRTRHFHPTVGSKVASRATCQHARRSAADPLEGSVPGHGRVVGAVHVPLRIVDEAVFGAFDDDDLAVVAPGPRARATRRCRRAASTGRSEPKNASVGHIWAATASGSMRWPGPVPRFRRAHHPVERDRARRTGRSPQP